VSDIPASVLRDVLSYDPETGLLHWKWRPREFFKSDRSWKIWNTRYAGREAFAQVRVKSDTLRYRTGVVMGRTMKAHRVAWTIHTGAWPAGVVEHIDNDGENNRFVNLKGSTQTANMKNARLSRANTSGVCGVVWSKLRSQWMARIRVNYRQIHLGYFGDLADAAAARRAAEAKYGFHENHGRVAA